MVGYGGHGPAPGVTGMNVVRRRFLSAIKHFPSAAKLQLYRVVKLQTSELQYNVQMRELVDSLRIHFLEATDLYKNDGAAKLQSYSAVKLQTSEWYNCVFAAL